MRLSFASCFFVKYFDVAIEHWYSLVSSEVPPRLLLDCELLSEREFELEDLDEEPDEPELRLRLEAPLLYPLSLPPLESRWRCRP